MRPNRASLVVVCLGLLGGCASQPTALPLLDPVGPLSGQAYRPTRSAVPGTLQVYTQTLSRMDGGIEYYPNTPYELYDATGKFVRRVMNSTMVSDQTPAQVELTAGLYFVKALAPAMGRIEIPVIILPQQFTLVNVQQQGTPRYAATAGPDWVRLANDWPVGRRAAFEPGAKPPELESRQPAKP